MDHPQQRRELESIHGACFGWALTCCGWNRDEAEEVLQAAYLKTLDGRARFDGLSSLRTWFFGVVRRTAAERRRRRLARAFAVGNWVRRRPAPEPAADPEQVSRDAEDRERLRQLLDRLTRRQRELLHLVFYQELTIEQAAGVLGISLGTARTHYERAKARLRSLLASTETHHEAPRRNRPEASRTVYGG